MKCGSPNGQINKIRQVMKRSLLSTTLELLSSRSSESFEQYSPTKKYYQVQHFEEVKHTKTIT